MVFLSIAWHDQHLINLAPEDCENIIQLSAKDDTCNIGFDQFIGAGLLDAVMPCN